MIQNNRGDGYKGNPLIKAAGEKIEFTQEQVKEYIRCMQSPVHFVETHMKIVHVDRGIIGFDLYDYQKRIINTIHENRYTICKLPRQSGKALDLDTDIPTPDGWKTMRDLNVGDHVFGSDGNPTKIIGKSEVHSDHVCYKVYFDAADPIIADAEHEWEIHTVDGYKILTTESIIPYIKNDDSPYISAIKGVEYPEQKFTVAPFSLGVLLRDDLSEDVSIASKYIFCSIQQRKEFIRGIFSNPIDQSTFIHKSEVLCTQIIEILASLGIKSVLHKKTKFEKYNRVTINIEKINHYITKIEKIESRSVQCIRVDAPNKLFLAGRGYVPTHNSSSVGGFILHYALFNAEKKIAILANKEKTAKKLLADIKKAFEYLPKWLQQGVVEWNKTSITLENGSKITASATSADAIRGDSYSLVYLDEFAFVPENQAEEFFMSVFPTISSGSTTKLIVTSTPKGLNHFYKMWTDAEENRSGFVPIEIDWRETPGRDDEWIEKETKKWGQRFVDQEYRCVHGDTIIEVRHKETKEIMKVKIKHFYEFCCV